MVHEGLFGTVTVSTPCARQLGRCSDTTCSWGLMAPQEIIGKESGNSFLNCLKNAFSFERKGMVLSVMCIFPFLHKQTSDDGPKILYSIKAGSREYTGEYSTFDSRLDRRSGARLGVGRRSTPFCLHSSWSFSSMSSLATYELVA